jgi:hypothetical protein
VGDSSEQPRIGTVDHPVRVVLFGDVQARHSRLVAGTINHHHAPLEVVSRAFDRKILGENKGSVDMLAKV